MKNNKTKYIYIAVERANEYKWEIMKAKIIYETPIELVVLTEYLTRPIVIFNVLNTEISKYKPVTKYKNGSVYDNTDEFLEKEINCSDNQKLIYSENKETLIMHLKYKLTNLKMFNTSSCLNKIKEVEKELIEIRQQEIEIKG